MTRRSVSENSKTELAALGDLMRRAGVSPDRVAAMISEIIAGDVESRSIVRLERELGALRETTGDGFEQLHLDQECASKEIASSIRTLKHQVFVFQSNLLSVMRFIKRAIIVMIILGLITVGMTVYQFEKSNHPSSTRVEHGSGKNSDYGGFHFGHSLFPKIFRFITPRVYII
jgi:hypothetical protein